MMVDCASPRCAQDRRLLKKELLSWTKKVPILLGLEQIAEAYTGKHVFQTLMEPFQDLELPVAEDWDPNAECHYCQSNSNSDKEIVDSDPDPEVTSNTDTDGVDYYQHYLPMGYPSNYSLDGSTLDNCKPLDLSASSRFGDHSNSDQDDSSHPLVELKVPQITNKIGKKKELGGKKSYSEYDLSAAVSDIRSGKLGTRRAAALYGIPRSTLRNKIFRMESENVCERPCIGNLSMADLLQNMATNGEATKTDWTPDDWEQRLDLLRRKHDLNAGMDRPFGMPPLFFNSRNLMDCEREFGGSSSFDYEAKMPFLQELVRKFAEHRMEAERAECLSSTFLSDMSQASGMYGNGVGGMGFGSPSMPTGGLVDLKIPSYKPMRSYMNNTSAANGIADLATASTTATGEDDTSPLPNPNSKINDTLKDIIAKTIAEKVRSRGQPLEGDVPMTSPMMNGYLKRELDSPSNPTSVQAKRFKRESKTGEKYQQNNIKQEINEQQPQKKTRPKRGQYRKYNSQLLLEAVRAVQRGEMSVHRAGSYFGVPHSTLEYKVKERHLMRQKKPREPRGKKTPNRSTATSVGLTGLNIPTPSSTNSSKLENNDNICEQKRHEMTPSPATSITEASSQDSSCQDSFSMAHTPAHETFRPDPEMIAHSINSLLSAQAAGLPLPGGNPFSNFYMAGALPMGFGWPPAPMMNGGLPLGMPDPAMAACFPGFGSAGPGINLSASDLLKKLQKKVQASTSGNVDLESSRMSHEASQPLQGSKSGSSQVIVK